MKLNGKVALITGSSRGIGRSTAIKFAEEGANIVINYKNNKEKALEVLDIIKSSGSDAIIVQCDVSKEDQVKQMVEESIKKFGKIDILVNNAGIVYDIPLFDKTVEQWKEVINTNLIGSFICSKYCSKHMKKQGSGSIINISSTNGINALSPYSADYDTSKAGLISLTKNMAEELGPNIRVNSIAPGWVDTDINKDLPEDFVEDEKKKIILKRFGKPEEIASAALFLASEDSSFMTRAIIMVDGGYI